jgi:hypothetical protein
MDAVGGLMAAAAIDYAPLPQRGVAATKRHLKRKDAKTQRTESDGGDFLELRSCDVLVAKNLRGMQ